MGELLKEGFVVETFNFRYVGRIYDLLAGDLGRCANLDTLEARMEEREEQVGLERRRWGIIFL